MHNQGMSAAHKGLNINMNHICMQHKLLTKDVQQVCMQWGGSI